MSNPEEYRNLPPQMKRFARTVLTVFVGAMIAAPILGLWLGFWPTLISLSVIVVAVLMPLARAAKQEREAQQARSESSRPSS